MLESADAPVLRDDSPDARPPLLRPRRTAPRTVSAFTARFGGVRVDVGGRDADETRDVTLIVGHDRVPYSPRRDARTALREAGWL